MTRRHLRGLAGLATVWLIAAPAHAGPLSYSGYSGVYIFGDSLVDPGNAKKAAQTFDFFPGVDNPAPTAAGYYNGRFSNGYTYADHMSLAITGKPSKTVLPYGFPLPLFGQIGFSKPSGNNLNFGYGGAQAIRGDEDVPGFKAQVDSYKDLPGPADPNALYVVNFGGNDLFQVIAKNYTAAQTADYLTRVSVRVKEQVARLETMGAQHILLASAPNIGLVPKYSALSDSIEPSVRSKATAAAQQLDLKLRSALGTLTPASGFTAELDLFSFLDFSNALMANPAAFGMPPMTNFRDQCIQARRPDAYGNIDCTGFAYFDQVHPTAETHRAIFGAMTNLLFPNPTLTLASAVTAADVPGPAALGLFAFGTGLVIVRRRRRATAERPYETAVSRGRRGRGRCGARASLGATRLLCRTRP